MARYKLPDALGGAEIEATECPELLSGRPTGQWAYVGKGFSLTMHGRLVEVVPPAPPEPEPGAYMIGGVLCVRFSDGWDDDSDAAQPWSECWDRHGGPDVEIVRLVPDPAHGVTLPWKGFSPYGTPVRIHEPDVDHEIQIDVGHPSGSTPHLAADTAEQMGSALIAAARKAREAK